MSPKKASLLMIVGAVLWGTNPALIKLSAWTPLGIAWFRALFCVSLLAFFLFYWRKLSFQSLGLQFFCAFFLAANSVFFVSASFYTTPANAVLLMFCFPWITMMLDFWFLGRRPARGDLLRLLLGFLGITIIVSGGFDGDGGLGNGFALLSGVSVALHIFLCQKLEMRHGGNQEILTAIMLAWVISLVGIAPWAFSEATISAVSDGDIQWQYLALFGLFSAIPWLLWSQAVAYIPGHVVGALLGVEVCFAALLGWWWLGEVPPDQTWLGGCLTLLAAIWQISSMGNRASA